VTAASASSPATAAPASPAPPALADLHGWPLVSSFLRRYAAPFWPYYVSGVLFLLATNGLNIAIPRLIKEVFDALGAGETDISAIRLYTALICVAAVSVILVRTLSRVLFFNPGRTIEYRVKNDMLQRLLAAPPTFFRAHAVGDLVSRATSDANSVRALVGFSILMLLNAVFAGALSFWQMMVIDPWLTLGCLVPLGVGIAVLRLGIKRLFVSMVQAQERLGALSDHILETYNGMAVVHGAAAERAFLRRFDEHNDGYTALHLQIAAVRCYLLPITGLMGNICVLLMLYVGGRHAVQGQLTVGDLAAYASYISVLVGAATGAGWVIGVLQRGYVALRRTWAIADLPELSAGGEVALEAPTPEAGGVQVEVRGLTYRYPDAEPGTPPVLQDIELRVPAGGVLGVYGEVGSGKSTLIHLIAGLLDPPAGTVLYDGAPLESLQPQTLRAAVAVVPQESFLFSRSLRENIAFVDAVDDIDDERVAAALERAQLGDEVERFPDGLQTVVGERGLTLSGGQRQRAQLARAFYRPARLLVLDDVLSAVDHETEERLLETIRAQFGERGGAAQTAIIVSHRVSALAGADEIIVLQGGRVVDRGTHAALIDRGGVYADAAEAQRED
jgi:ATP-binding cassette subfamily B protein